jgi:hypothetical protein
MLLNWDGGCPPVGACRGVDEAGNCRDLPGLFATTPVPPYFPNGLSEYTCHTFPDDDRTVDSIIVALIALAIALPVTVFIATCFSVANDSECPESWLQRAGLARLLLGGGANRNWHYTKGKPPSRFVRWYCRCVEAPLSETAANLWRSFKAFVTRTRPPWIKEAEKAERAAHARHAAAAEDDGMGADASHAGVVRVTSAHGASDSSAGVGGGGNEHLAPDAPDAFDALSTHPMGKPGADRAGGHGDDEAAALARFKHRLTALGIVAVYVIWCAHVAHACACLSRACRSRERLICGA